MKRAQLLALLFGTLLVLAPLARADNEYDDGLEDEEEEEDDHAQGGETEVHDPDTVVGTAANFDEVVLKAPFALVEFYAPWCGHCKTLAPHYAKAATLLRDYTPKVAIVKVDATKENQLGQKYGIQGFPTIKWFIDGDVVADYDGGRDTESIVTWIKKKTGPAAVTISSADELSKLEGENQVIGVGYFKAFEGPEYDAFKKAATKVDALFVQTTSAEVAAVAGLKEHGLATIKTFFGEPRETSQYEGAFEEEPIKAWLNGERLPTTIEFTQESAQKIFSAGIDKQLFMWGKASDFFTDAPVFKAVREAAKKFKGKLIFVTSNNEADSSQPITNYFGLKEATGPVLIGFYQQGNKKYRYSGDTTDTAAIAAFAQSVLDGTAAGDYKGAPLPAEPKDEGVTVIVRDNFDEIVMDPKKDVFLEVYAPWCGHCKSLAPIWSEMAGKLAGVESVVIAKMDGTENEHAQAEVQGFPTLLFFPAEEGKKPVPYSGARDLESLLSFVAEQAKIPFEVEGVSKPEAKEDADEEAEEGAKDEL